MVEVSKTEDTIIRNVIYGLWFVLVTLVVSIQAILKALIPASYLPSKKLEGEIALVTGGASGIGRLVALKLAKLGVVVVIWDVNTKGVEETVEQVKAAGGKCYGYTCDLTNREDIYRVAAKVNQDVGQISILINNAGVAYSNYLLDIPDHLIQRTFDVNIIAHFWTTKAFLPKMIESNHGHIVTIASMAGFIGCHKMIDYCATKYAAVGFNESLRLELDNLGAKEVKTTVICPYFIRSTGMFNDVQLKVLPNLNTDSVAERIVKGIRREEFCVMIPGYLRVIAFKILLPWSATSLILRSLVINPSPHSVKSSQSALKPNNNPNSKEELIRKEDRTVTQRTVEEKTL